MQEDTEEHKLYQEQLISENDMLRAEIQSMKQHHARREQDFLHTLEDVNQEHKRKLDQVNREHTEKFNSLNSESQQRIDRLQRDNHDKLSQVTT